MLKNKCYCGNNKNINIVYNEKIRSGSYGNLTKKKHRILNCKKCDLTYLENPKEKFFQETREYRKKLINSRLFNKIQINNILLALIQY